MQYTKEQLNSFDKDLLIQLFLSQQEQTESLTKEVRSLNNKIQLILEQLADAKRSRFGRSSEKMNDPAQIRFMEVDGEIVFFNEAEAVYDPESPEPQEIEIKSFRRKKTAGKKEADIAGLKTNRIDHYLSDDELTAEFGDHGWKQLPDEISKHYVFIPARVEIDEHHVGVYADKKENRIIRAPHPKSLLRGSLVSPTIAASIMNGKYVNAVPLYRLEKEFERYGLAITRQNMANWMIRLGEEYLGILYDRLHEMMYSYHVIQADETYLYVNHDGRPAGTKSFMWVYRTGELYTDRPIVLYEYQKTRNSSHPREFLRSYSGICVTDGYQVYHTVGKQLEDLKIAGCWIHGRRKIEKALHAIPKPVQNKSVAYLLMKQIQAIYREEGKLKDLSPEERLKQRQLVIRPLVDAFFVFLKLKRNEIPLQGNLKDGFNYFINQESYLRVFLEDGEVPMDNNATERAIRGFCVGRKNWQLIDTINGARSSAIIYSIAETAKANNLKPYDYFAHLLTEIPKHMEEKDRAFLDDLLPWSPKLPEHIRK